MASRDPKDHLSFLKIFEGFSFDDFGFDPFGYSLNGFKEKSYMTLHVTPQSIGSYISLETNMKLGTEGLSALLDHVVNDFEPNSFDVFSFHPSKWLPIQPEARAYSAKRHIQSQLPSGFYINFYHFYAPTQMRADPIELF
jgi:S-adenosylmethionine decarboxylase